MKKKASIRIIDAEFHGDNYVEIEVNQVIGNFAIHKPLHLSDRYRWTVTHVPSGAVACNARTLKIARDAIESFQRLDFINWEETRPLDKLTKGQMEQARHIRQIADNA